MYTLIETNSKTARVKFNKLYQGTYAAMPAALKAQFSAADQATLQAEFDEQNKYYGTAQLRLYELGGQVKHGAIAGYAGV